MLRKLNEFLRQIHSYFSDYLQPDYKESATHYNSNCRLFTIFYFIVYIIQFATLFLSPPPPTGGSIQNFTAVCRIEQKFSPSKINFFFIKSSLTSEHL